MSTTENGFSSEGGFFPNVGLSGDFRLIPDPSGCYEGEFVQITTDNRNAVEAERSLFCAPELAALASKNAQFEELVQAEASRVQAVIAPKEGYI